MIIKPTWLGEPWYPGGFPLNAHQLRVNDQTMFSIYLNFNRNPTAEDEETIKSYIVYYINAPVYDSEFTDELRRMDLMAMPLDEVITHCLDFGLDPI